MYLHLAFYKYLLSVHYLLCAVLGTGSTLTSKVDTVPVFPEPTIDSVGKTDFNSLLTMITVTEEKYKILQECQVRSPDIVKSMLSTRTCCDENVFYILCRPKQYSHVYLNHGLWH